MPRSLSVASRLYEPGTYGPYSVDDFTTRNTEELVARFTVEDWPQDDEPLFKVSIAWDSGDGSSAVFFGRQVGKDGNPMSAVSLSSAVPRVPNDGNNGGKLAVSGGTISVEVFRPFRTAIAFGAA